jgi:uncharacterized protein
MKFLIVLLVVAVAGWMLLRGRKADQSSEPTRSRKQSQQTMIRCSHCGIHLPQAEALAGDRGFFCSQEHRLAGPGVD